MSLLLIPPGICAIIDCGGGPGWCIEHADANEIVAELDQIQGTGINHQAQKQIPTLIQIYRQNPDWIFQGKSVSQLVDMSVKFLDECGLHQSAQRLDAAKSSK